MDLNLALSIMRTGEGKLRPIIDYYAQKKNDDELIPYIDDKEIGPSVIYVLSELPTVSPSVVAELKRLSVIGRIDRLGREWAKEIIFNHS